MSLSSWLPFVLAASIILIVPGPTIILVVSQALSHGRRSVIPLAAGVVCGDFTAMTLSLAGLGALMAASAALFNVLKWVGALYLVYLGITLWRSETPLGNGPWKNDASSAASLFRSSFIVTALNPKSIAFFVAFLPQFITTNEPVLPQFVLLGTTFLTLALVNAALYGLFAGHLRDLITSEAGRKWLNRCGGAVLVGAGIITAGLQHAS